MILSAFLIGSEMGCNHDSLSVFDCTLRFQSVTVVRFRLKLLVYGSWFTMHGCVYRSIRLGHEV